MVTDLFPPVEPPIALIAAPTIAGLLPARVPEQKPVGVVKFVGMVTKKPTSGVIALPAHCASSEYVERPRSRWEASQMATAAAVIGGYSQPFESRYRDMLLAAALGHRVEKFKVRQ